MSVSRLVRSGLFSLVLLLSGCGGGGGGGGASNQAFGGLWDGDWFVDGGTGGTTAIGITTDDGRFQLLLLDETTQEAFVQISGTAVVTGNQVSGEGLAYTLMAGDSFPGGSTLTEFSFTGTLSQRNTLMGTWEIAAGDSGDFDFVYDELQHERDASLPLLEGSWLPFDFSGLPAGPAFNIDSLGQVFRQTPVCTSNSTITIPDPKFNVYAWSATVASTTSSIDCPVAGDYTGLGTLGDSEAPGSQPNDAQVVLLSNPERALPLLLLREP